MSNGIDYGMGQSNVDKANGIRYGVISQNEVLQAWCDSSEAYYGKPHCPKCGDEIENDSDACPHCEKLIRSDDIYGDEPISHYIDDKEYSAECGESGDIFITRSPYYTLCAFCSPCAPGAGFIMDTRVDGIKAYCFGHDFFENNAAPYPVYSVATGEIVEASK